MKFSKTLLYLVCMFVVMMTFSKCATTKPFEAHVPFEIDEVYYQDAPGNVKGVDSGVHIYIQIENKLTHITLDSVYFRGKQTELEYINENMYVGQFKSETFKKMAFIMSSDPYAEYGNKIPQIPDKPRFYLEDDACIISYKIGDTVKYFKIQPIHKKEATEF
ncbi:hypothetical protein [Mariniflexile sp. AS56]|uniref:hypothetical protein n=1 Tax=Mariniflexile sp. AS56 TaxID=3063957 RepID=UPI0026F324F9|nr:hypothetical protein [Mariniflexile sp. AS56]MDO7172188.1 hypothetical protein [Mariniflexile sp. AS56]